MKEIPAMPATHRHAFTLVELAIVLAIIGLIAGAIAGGKSLLNASRANKIGIEGQNYLNAIEQFRTRYQALPGDMVNATQYWGAAACPNGAGTGTQTCNGNGNRLIAPWDEMYRSWQHLANAGLIQGRYTGRYTLVAGRGIGVPGSNIPNGIDENTGWSMIALTLNSGINYEFGYSNGSTTYENFLLSGSANTAEWANGAVINGADALQVDTKFDDASPGNGRIIGGVPGTCTTTNNTTTAQYAAGVKSPICMLGWIISTQ